MESHMKAILDQIDDVETLIKTIDSLKTRVWKNEIKMALVLVLDVLHREAKSIKV